MPTPLSGPGVGLPLPQNLYPSEIGAGLAPYDYPTNEIALVGGQQVPIPAGDWYVSLGQYLWLEYYDPVQTLWVSVASGTNTYGPLFVKSDGFNFRITNRLACPVGGVVLASSGSFVQATTSITVSTGNSTWIPFVGGAYSVSSIIGVGAGYGVPPIVIIPAPPPASSNTNGVGGRQAIAYAVMGSGTLTTVSMVDQGAGYPGGVTVVLQPNPTDPNLSVGITLATVAFSTVFAGSITGLICTNPGNPIANPTTCSISVAGAGGGATVNPVMLVTATLASVSVGGAGFGLAGYVSAGFAGGQYPTQVFANTRESNNIFMRPRPGQIRLTVSGTNGSIAAQSGVLMDSGLFFLAGQGTTPTASINVALGASAGTAGSIIGPAFVMGFGGSNVFDMAVLQPAP
jgi:hypothetical protein